MRLHQCARTESTAFSLYRIKQNTFAILLQVAYAYKIQLTKQIVLHVLVLCAVVKSRQPATMRLVNYHTYFTTRIRVMKCVSVMHCDGILTNKTRLMQICKSVL